MTDRVESTDCRYGFHLDCLACPGTCHGRGRAPVWDPTVSTQEGCRGTTWTAERDDAA